jgi:hypothetical protein
MGIPKAPSVAFLCLWLALLHSASSFTSIQNRALTCRSSLSTKSFFVSTSQAAAGYQRKEKTRLMMSDGQAAATPKKGFVEKVSVFLS